MGADAPSNLEICYEPGSGAAAWSGFCRSFPALRVDAATIHAVDLALMPLLTSALQDRYHAPVAVNVLPGAQTRCGDGSYRKIVAVVPASTPCSIQSTHHSAM